MTSQDRDWRWSDEQKDYYRFKARTSKSTSGKIHYDIEWGRSSIESPDQQERPRLPVDLPLHPRREDSEGGSPPSDPSNQPGAVYRVQPPHHQIPILEQPESFDRLRQIGGTSPGLPLDNTSYPGLFGPFYFPGNPGSGFDSTSTTPGPPSVFTPPTSIVTPSSPRPGERIISELKVSGSKPTEHTKGPGDADDEVVLSYDSAPDSHFETIQNPRRYFRKGKVIKVIWPEPQGESIEPQSLPDLADSDTASTALQSSRSQHPINPTSQSIHVKPRLFVVIRSKQQHCLGLPIYTYSQQGTSKPGVRAEDHAPVVAEGSEPFFHPNEDLSKLKKSLIITIDGPNVQWDPLSRLNFTKVMTIEHNLKIRKVGRIPQGERLDYLETLFREGIGFGEEPTVA